MNKEEFHRDFTHALDAIAQAMAENPEVAPEKFFQMVCILENLQYFSPVLFNALKKKNPELPG